MSHQAVTWAYAQDITPSGAKFVLVTLANYASQDGYCFPSQLTLARDTGQTDRAVRSHIERLEALGILIRERRTDKHGHRKSDGFWLVGFKSLPEDVSANQPEQHSSRQPEESAARVTSLPEKNVEPTGKKRQSLPEDFSGPYIEGTVSIEPSEEPSVNGRARKRDVLWDALVEVFGFSPTDGTDEHGAWNKALVTWRKIHATPDDIHTVAVRYRQEMPKAAFTVSAITRHAERLLRGTKPDALPRFEDIKNPMLKAMTQHPDNLDDIEAELRAKHDPEGRFPRQASGPRQLPADAGRNGYRSTGTRADVLPAPRRTGSG